jgi:HAD superfamily hydrolase (TIGR01549 family)/HAD superfamily hydrolase (TIGR01509 family)
MSIRAVFFDMGGTIETFGRTAELCLQATPGLQRLLRSAGIDLQLDVEHLYRTVIAGLNAYHAWSLETLEELPSERVWREFVFPAFPIDPEKLKAAAEQLMLYVETQYYQRAMRPEVPQALEAIRGMGLKIGLISNVNSRSQVPVNLDEYGIRHYFDPIVLSSEYGRRKPDPAIFHYAARLAEVPTGECAYIGDRIARDILGARRAGYKLAVQIRHEYAHGEDDSGAVPDAVVDSMDEFVDLLRAEMAAPASPVQTGTAGQVRALLFDAGDILYYRRNTGHKLAAYLQKFGMQYRELPRGLRNRLRDKAYQGQITDEEYYEEVLQYTGVTLPEQIARGKELLREESNETSFFEGVRETLAELDRMGFLLGIITDTAVPVHVKLGWFERGGFGDVWDSIISSKELGVRKPKPGIYQAALRQLGVPASQAAFVGHKKSELDGARNVGLKTIAFNYEENVEADYFINHFSELLDVPLIAHPDAVGQRTP